MNARIPRETAEEQALNEEDDDDPSKKKEFANPIVILNRMVARSDCRNREKERLSKRYVRNARIIDQAFEVIKKNSGMTNLDEIVCTYLKAEE